jgi:hypothetical protein
MDAPRMPAATDLCDMSTTLAPRTLETLAPNARVWVYKSARTITAEERNTIRVQGQAFTASWAAHGAPLDACVDVLHGHFVVIAVDEQQAMASGCSIDKSVRFVRGLEQGLGLSLTDRMVVLYEREGSIHTCRVSEVEGLLRDGTLTADTLVFDDLVSTKGDLDARFRAPLRTTWMARYL